MYIILVYIAGAIVPYDNLHIVSEDGEPILFGSGHSAEEYAVKNCSRTYKRTYKIVEL